MKKLISLILLAWLCDLSYSQNRVMDSLLKELQNAKQDTMRLRLYLVLGDSCDIKDNLIYGEQALHLCDKLLLQTTNDSVRKKILMQRASASNLIAVYYSQSSKADSLLSLLKDDTNKVNTLNAISAFKSLDYGNAMKYAEEAKLLSQKINFKKGEGDAYYNIGNIHLTQLMYRDSLSLRNHFNDKGALNNFLAALQLRQELNDKRAIATTNQSIADSYQQLGDYPNFLKYCYISLSLFKELNDTSSVANAYFGLGLVFQNDNDNEEARKNYNESLKLSEAIRDKYGISAVYQKLGAIFLKEGNYTEALKNDSAALLISEEIKYAMGVAQELYHIGTDFEMHGNAAKAKGEVHESIVNFKIARESYLSSLKMFEEWQNEHWIADLNTVLGIVSIALNETAAAKKYLDKSLAISIAINNKGMIMANYKHLTDLSIMTGNYKEAISYYQKQILYKDSIFSEADAKKVVELYMQDDFDKKEAVSKAEQEKKDIKQRNIRNSIIAGLSGALIFLVVVYRQRNKISKARKRSDELLLNILPAETAEELKNTGTTIAKDFAEVTVMFTDFKNFTLMSEKLSAQELVNEINYCYSAFDNIITKHGIEKIKTIGDSYMCAGGLPVANKTNAEDCVCAASEIRDFMLAEKQKREAEGKLFFEIRIGCHTGPVVAGIVGIKKFAYDIWGDTVNIASRMESSGEAGKVNISGATYELVKNKFNCTHRGKIEAKNKGMINMYFVES